MRPMLRALALTLGASALAFTFFPRIALADIPIVTVTQTFTGDGTLTPMRLTGQSACSMSISGAATLTPYGTSVLVNGAVPAAGDASYSIVPQIGVQTVSGNQTFGDNIAPYLTGFYVAVSSVSGTAVVTQTCSAAIAIPATAPSGSDFAALNCNAPVQCSPSAGPTPQVAFTAGPTFNKVRIQNNNTNFDLKLNPVDPTATVGPTLVYSATTAANVTGAAHTFINTDATNCIPSAPDMNLSDIATFYASDGTPVLEVGCGGYGMNINQANPLCDVTTLRWPTYIDETLGLDIKTLTVGVGGTRLFDVGCDGISFTPKGFGVQGGAAWLFDEENASLFEFTVPTDGATFQMGSAGTNGDMKLGVLCDSATNHDGLALGDSTVGTAEWRVCPQASPGALEFRNNADSYAGVPFAVTQDGGIQAAGQSSVTAYPWHPASEPTCTITSPSTSCTTTFTAPKAAMECSATVDGSPLLAAANLLSVGLSVSSTTWTVTFAEITAFSKSPKAHVTCL